MRTSTPFLPTPLTLWTLLLIAVSSSAQTGKWDQPTCTEGVVSVSRGKPAAMTCNISNPFSLVCICMVVPGDCQPIFWNVTQGHFSQGPWHLWIEEGMAQLGTKEAQENQTGQYKWHLLGSQRNIAFTSLNVSGVASLGPGPFSGTLRTQEQPTEREPWEPPFAPSSWALGTLDDLLEAQSHSQAQDQVQSQHRVTLVVVLTALCILGLCALVWFRRCRSPKFQLLPQVSWF